MECNFSRYGSREDKLFKNENNLVPYYNGYQYPG